MPPASQAAEARDHPDGDAPGSSVGARLLRAMRPANANGTPLRRLGWVLLAVAVVFPWLGGAFYTRLAIEALLLACVALSVDILLGYAGLLSLGQAAYFGLAAYIAALMYLPVT
jgi:hypothetical protein